MFTVSVVVVVMVARAPAVTGTMSLNRNLLAVSQRWAAAYALFATEKRATCGGSVGAGQRKFAFSLYILVYTCTHIYVCMCRLCENSANSICYINKLCWHILVCGYWHVWNLCTNLWGLQWRLWREYVAASRSAHVWS